MLLCPGLASSAASSAPEKLSHFHRLSRSRMNRSINSTAEQAKVSWAAPQVAVRQAHPYAGSHKEYSLPSPRTPIGVLSMQCAFALHLRLSAQMLLGLQIGNGDGEQEGLSNVNKTKEMHAQNKRAGINARQSLLKAQLTRNTKHAPRALTASHSLSQFSCWSPSSIAL